MKRKSIILLMILTICIILLIIICCWILSAKSSSKRTLMLTATNKTSILMPEILRICESIGISHNGSVAFSYLWKSDEKINEGYLKIVDSGIFNLLEEHILSDDEKLSVLNDIDFINGYKAFQVLFYFCNVGIVREIDDGQLAKASRQIEILMYVRSEYPTLHSIADNKESHMIICRNLIKKKLQVQSRSL